MRLCPVCGNRYSDDTLKYCLQDGTELLAGRPGEMPTAMLREVDTAEPVKRGGPTTQNEWRGGSVPAIEQKTRSNTAIAVILTALGMLILFGFGGIALWLYSRNTQSQTGVTVSNTNNSGIPNPTPRISPTAAPSPTRAANTTPQPDDSQSRAEVVSRLDSWKSESERLDLDSYMTHYASTVDYYNKSGASSAFVRDDKRRAFERYTSIRINLSNVSVSTIDGGQRATAIFDKEWEFRGNGTSCGKVRQLMRLERTSGQWLITAEKDLQLYHKRC